MWGSVFSTLCSTRWSKTSARWSQRYPPIRTFFMQNTHIQWRTSIYMKINMFLDDSLLWWVLRFLPLASGHLGDLKQTPAGVRSCFCNHIYFLWSPRVCVRVAGVALPNLFLGKHTGGRIRFHTLTESEYMFSFQSPARRTARMFLQPLLPSSSIWGADSTDCSNHTRFTAS